MCCCICSWHALARNTKKKVSRKQKNRTDDIENVPPAEQPVAAPPKIKRDHWISAGTPAGQTGRGTTIFVKALDKVSRAASCVEPGLPEAITRRNHVFVPFLKTFPLGNGSVAYIS